MVVLVALMLPPQVAVVPLYVMWAKLGLVGTLWPLIIPVWFGDAFAIFLLRQFFLTIPEEYLDAARVDGCGEFRILTTVVVRLAKPAIAAVALFSVLYCFNDFFLPLLYVGENQDNWVISIGLSQFRSLHQVQWNLVMAATILVMLPVLILFFLAQRAFVEGVTLTGGKQGMKIAVIGGGSTYTPELVSGLSRERDKIDVRELVLHDIDEERREVVGGLAARMLERQGYAGELEVTGDLDRALDGADFVLIQIRVGGQQARLSDETVPLACGCIGQETTGAGGFAKALRTVPVVLEIAERVRELSSSDAWIVDFTNPVGIVTRSLLDAGHRAVGLCNVAIGFQRSFARLLGVQPGQVVVDQVGLNHLTWIRSVNVDGRDVLPELMASHGDAVAEQAALPRQLLEELGVVPSPYLQYFYRHDAILAGPTRRHAARGGRGRDRARPARALPRPEPEREARVARATRRRLLQRGRHRARDVARHGRRRRARGGPAQRRHPRRPCRRRRGRGSGTRRERAACPAPAGAPRAGAARPDPARGRVRAACRAGRSSPATRRSRARRCSRIR